MKNKIVKNILLVLLVVTFFFSAVNAQQIYFVDNQALKVQKSDNDGNNLGDIIVSADGIVIGLYGIASDVTNNKIYFTNVETDEIFTSTLNGSSFSVLINSADGIDGPRGIAIDGVNNKIYWAEVISGKIKKADLDGNNIEEVLTGLSSPVDVALDLVNNKLYWSDNGFGQKKISRCNLDGTTPEDIITGLDQVAGIEVDAESGKLYWVDFGASDKVARANLDGTSPEDLVTIASGSPRGISVDKDNNKLFWSDVIGQSIWSSSRDGSSSSAILSNLSHPIAISSDWMSALPVELTSFSVNVVENSATLNWETATEVNNYGFEILRSAQNVNHSGLADGSEKDTDNESWDKIAFVQGHGNSNSPKYYAFTDKSIQASGKYYYRLKQIDIDGTFEYSDIIEAEIGIPKNYELKQNYPNPFNPSTTISYSIPNDGQVTLVIYDVLGNEVAVLDNSYKSAGNYTYDFDATNLSSGLYFYTIRSGKFVETKKMLLMK